MDSIKRINPLYDEHSLNQESFSFCIGYNDHIDLSQFNDEEVIFSEEFDTYCLVYYCGHSADCLNCSKLNKNAKNGKT